MNESSLVRLVPIDSDLRPIPHAPVDWEVPTGTFPRDDRSLAHANHLWVGNEYVRVGCAVVAMHPLDRDFPMPEGTSWADWHEALGSPLTDDEESAYGEYLSC